MYIIKESQKDSSQLISKFLKEGKTVSFATDTVYGIAVDASNYKAIENLYKIKKRQENKPIAILVKNLEMAKKIFEFDSLSEKIANNYLPGALTLVLKTKSDNYSFLAKNLSNIDDGFLGFRIIETDFIKKIFDDFDGAIALTSANISGQKSSLNAQEVEKYFDESMIDLLVDSGETKLRIHSTVVKITNGGLTILRNGAIDIKLYENN